MAPRGLMVIAVGFWLLNPLAQEDWVRTPVLELNWSELEVVVAGEGGHCVGRGPPSCLVYATHTPARLHQNDWTMNTWLKKNESIGIIWRLKQLSIFE